MTTTFVRLQASANAQPNRAVLIAGTAIAAFFLVNTVWVLLDQKVWPWDHAWYGEVTLDVWLARAQGFANWFNVMVHSMPSKPPLLTWVAQFLVPLTRLSIEIESALLLGNVLFATATLWLVYAVTRSLRAGSIEALAAVVLCGSAPLFVAFSHEFLVEAIQALIVAAMLLLAVRARDLPILRSAGLGILLTALGFLSKSTTELFILPFTVYLILAILIAPRDGRTKAGWREFAIFLVAGSVTAAAVIWYRANWPSLVQHFTDATSNEVAHHYGSPVILANKLIFWSTSLAAGLSPTGSLAALVFVVSIAGLVVTLMRVEKKPFAAFLAALVDNGGLFALACAGTVAAIILAYSLQINEEPRFLVPLFPIIAVLLGWSLAAVGRRMISIFVLLATLANAILVYGFVFGTNPFAITPTAWLRPIHLSREDKINLTHVVESTCNQTSVRRNNIIGVEYVELNANSASFYSAKQRRIHRHRCYYTSLGYAEQSIDQAMRRMDGVAPDYFVTVEPGKQKPPDFLNVVSRPVAELVANNPRFVLSPGSGDYLMVYRRLP